MSGWDLVLRGLRWRWFSNLLTTLGVAAGVGVVCTVLLVQADLQARLEEPGHSYGLVVGAPGSSQQLVLNAVFHLDDSPGVIPIELWRELDAHDSTELVVPYAVGDSFRGHRVVATTDAFFSPRFPHPPGSEAADKLMTGRPFADRQATRGQALSHSDPGIREAVVGASVHEMVGVRVGDRIELSHGLAEQAMAHDRERMWDVVGILERTDTALDGVVLIPLDSFLAMDEHARGEPGLSALLVFPRRGVHTATLLGELRRRPDLQVAHVGTEVRRLLGLVGKVDTLFLLVAFLLAAVAISSVFSTTYLAMQARKPHLAVLRALGLSRRSLLRLIVFESSLLAFTGAVLGWIGAHTLLYLVGDAVNAAVRFHPDPGRLVWSEATVVVLVTLSGAVAGVLPGIRAYQVDVVASLRSAE